MPARARDEGDTTSPRIGASHVGSARWFFHSKYKLMDRFLVELREAPDEAALDELTDRYQRALRHGLRVQRARVAVTVLLAFGIVTTVLTSVLRLAHIPLFDTGELVAVFDRVAAVAASAATLLIALRLAFDRYLQRVDVSATFLAMQIASAAKREPAPTTAGR